jgi:hypothetical protein
LNAAPDVSVCIVTLNAEDYLRDCLRSLAEHTRLPEVEVIVADNGSSDGVLEMLRTEFPAVRVIPGQSNQGFGRPTNQAMRLGRGRYLLLLNPDTVILPEAIDRLVAFLDDHPRAGICGPKILNRDGSLQKPCRRGVSRPWNTLSYMLGLAALFPRSRLFGGYLMTYMDENATHPVDGVSGACMLIRRAVVEQIGYLDERYFAYQEDADYCFQAQKAGWQIYYVPAAQITHYGGRGGSRAQPYRAIYEWHRSYFLFYRKNLARDYFFLFNWLFYLAMGIKLALSLLVNALRRDKFAGPRRG